MTSLYKLNEDLKEARVKIFMIVQEEDKFSSKEIFGKKLENACKKEEKIELKIKNYVINNYNGYEKFSKEILDHIYKSTLSTIEEYAIDLVSKIEFNFKENMKIIELAYIDGKNSQ